MKESNVIYTDYSVYKNDYNVDINELKSVPSIIEVTNSGMLLIATRGPIEDDQVLESAHHKARGVFSDLNYYYFKKISE